MSLLDSQLFPLLRHHMFYQAARNPSYRIELFARTPQELVTKALELEIPCAECGRLMNPFRLRAGKAKRGNSAQNIPYNACCPLKPPARLSNQWKQVLKIAPPFPADVVAQFRQALEEAMSYPRFCNRGDKASEEYALVVAALQGGMIP